MSMPLVDASCEIPADLPGVCFWCKEKIGEPHAKTCTKVYKKVKMRYTYELEIYVPHSWNKKLIEFHHSDSTWCANNSLIDLSTFSEELDNKPESECLCSYFKAKFIEVVDDRPVIR